MSQFKRQLLAILSLSVFGIIVIIAVLFFSVLKNQSSIQPKIPKTPEFIDFCGTKNYTSIGKELFNTNCAACHKLNGNHDFIKKQYVTYSDSTYFERYIRNEDSLHKTSDVKHTNEMYDGDYYPHHFDFLTEKDINELEIYIEAHITN